MMSDVKEVFFFLEYVHAQQTKTPMQHTGTPCLYTSYHPWSREHLPIAKSQEKSEVHMLCPT